MSDVKKPFAYIKGTQIVRHASEVLEGEEFEWNGLAVHPVMKKFFRYNPTGTSTPRETWSNPRESAAHIVTKDLLREEGRLYCVADGREVLLGLRDVTVETRIANTRPDVVGIVDWCAPNWNIAGQRAIIEVHFENRANDPDRVRALREHGIPVLEIHLPKKYLRDVDVPVNEPRRFRALLRAILSYGRMAGTWLRRPDERTSLRRQNAFTAQLT